MKEKKKKKKHINKLYTLDKQGWFTYGRLCGLSVCLTKYLQKIKKIKKTNKQKGEKLRKKKTMTKNEK